MKTYPLYLNEAQLRLVLDLLNSAVDDIATQIAVVLNGAQSEPEPPPFPLPAVRQKKPRKPAPVKRVEAIEQLAKTHSEASKELAAWRNKTAGVLGWDRWLRANYPSAAASLWPSQALADRKPVRNHA
jgi:hypothetical protein